MSPGDGEGGLRLAPESIEALAVRLAEILREGGEPQPASSMVDMIPASEVSRRWGVARRWVYDHREDLGAAELGDGPRPRLRFDPAIVAERLGAPGPGHRLRRPDRRRSTWIGASHISDSLSPRTRATVRPSREFRAGGGA
jgi:hypothetical protein